jgi:hypothetical protein
MQRDIKSTIERTLCPQHGKHPKLTFTARGDITVDCCCEKFQKDVIAKIEKASSDAAGKYLTKSISL